MASDFNMKYLVDSYLNAKLLVSFDFNIK